MNIKISSDSTCDLSRELINAYNIGITPLTVTVNGAEHKDGVSLTSADLLKAVESTHGSCSTTAVNVSDYEAAFKGYLEEADDVIQFHISSDMSACYQNANIAANGNEHIFTIDSRNLSTGIGLLVLDAAEMAQKGMSAASIKAALDEKKELLDVSFVIDTLDYLRRGGRCSSLAALGANLLSLHPMIEVKNGKMGVGKKYRGSIEKTITKYIDDRLKDQNNIDYHRIFITHSAGLSDEFLESVKAQVRSLGPFEEVLVTEVGCTVACHCGPKTLGLLYYRTSKEG